jgi:stage III sporulation protein AA
MDKHTDKFDEAAQVLPEEIRAHALFLPDGDKAAAEEFRLRCGRTPTVLLCGVEKPVCNICVTQSMLESVVSAASSASRHSVAECLKNGFVTAPGGHRIGICGTAVVREGSIESIRNVSSVCVRIARQIVGVSKAVVDKLSDCDGRPLGTLIISAPGDGKTTLLRDLVREFSTRGVRTAVIDERGEIAAVSRGEPQFDVGPCTDVMELAPRAEAVACVLRSMAPRLIALDEICTETDAEAISAAVGSGASILATAHASSLDELKLRPALKEVLSSGAFKRCVTIYNKSGKRTYRIGEL